MKVIADKYVPEWLAFCGVKRDQDFQVQACFNAPDDDTYQFQLKTKGRNRGYVERQEVDTRGRVQLEIEPKAGPELNHAIQRILGVVATGSKKSAIGQGDTLPPDFRPPD